MKSYRKTFGIIIIGNEILSGKTIDTNSNLVCRKLTSLGLSCKQVVVIPDDENIIIEKVNHLSELCQRQCGFLYSCLTKNNILPMTFSTQWLLTLYTYVLDGELLWLVWDNFFLYGWEFFFNITTLLSSKPISLYSSFSNQIKKAFSYFTFSSVKSHFNPSYFTLLIFCAFTVVKSKTSTVATLNNIVKTVVIIFLLVLIILILLIES